MKKPAYKRVLLKLSGHAFQGDLQSGICFETLEKLAKEIASVKALGVDIAIVNGAGNLFRGKMGAQHGMDEATGDYIGMIATLMNSLALQDAFEKIDVPTRVLTAIETNKVAEPYIRRRAIRHMEKGRIIICAGGIGNPFFTTDSAGVLRAIELDCDIMLKASNVDGVYDADPKENESASRFEKVTYQHVIEKHLKVMDATAVALAQEKQLPLQIFDFFKAGNLEKVVLGERIGTLVES